MGWVTADPYEYEITHPDGVENEYSRVVRLYFVENEVPEEQDIIYTDFGADFGSVEHTVEFPDVSGESHMEYIRDKLENRLGVLGYSFVIADE